MTAYKSHLEGAMSLSLDASMDWYQWKKPKTQGGPRDVRGPRRLHPWPKRFYYARHHLANGYM